MKIKITPDTEKSKSLQATAKITLERLHKTDIEQYPSNTLLDYYDAIHKLIEAFTLKEGTKIKGEGAHQELIDYLAKQRKIDEHTRQFLQQMRDYRNRISYEGFMVDKSYIQTHQKKIEQVIEHLFALLYRL